MKDGFSRRLFLQASMMAAAAQALSMTGCKAPASTKKSGSDKLNIQPIGLQLYSLPVLLQQDFKATLKTVSDLGYKEVEFAGPYNFSGTQQSGAPNGGYYGHTPAEVKKMLDDFGLTAPSAHIPTKDLQDNLAAVVEAAQVVGHKYLIVPFLSGEERASLDKYKSLADELNQIGHRIQSSGIQVAYHNHSFEFGKLDGTEPYDILLANTDADLVKFEMDLFWISISGKDPVEYFRKYPNRFPLVHCKNMATTQTLADPLHTFDSRESTEAAFANQSDLGKGTIDFKRILSFGRDHGVKHFIVERDRTKDVATASQELTTIQDGYRYLSSL